MFNKMGDIAGVAGVERRGRCNFWRNIVRGSRNLRRWATSGPSGVRCVYPRNNKLARDHFAPEATLLRGMLATDQLKVVLLKLRPSVVPLLITSSVISNILSVPGNYIKRNKP